MQDWLKVHRALMEAEAKLADMAVGYGSGSVTQAELDAQHKHVVALRALAKEVFEAALAGIGNGRP